MTTIDASRKKIIWLASLALLFTLTFCAGFAYFYTRQQQDSTSETPFGIGSPLPPAQLIDESNQVLADSELRHGKLILVFVTHGCDACLKESKFLQQAVGRRTDVTFYGVISFGDKDTVLREAKKEFPFKVFYDQHLQLAGRLGIKRVPIKLYIENGIIRKSWGGATIQEEKQSEFLSWLEKA